MYKVVFYKELIDLQRKQHCTCPSLTFCYQSTEIKSAAGKWRAFYFPRFYLSRLKKETETWAPFTRERSCSVISSFQFLERRNGLFTREWNDCVSGFVSVHTGTQSFRFTAFLQSLPFFLVTAISTHALEVKILSFRFLDQSCISLPVQKRNGTERLRIIPLFESLFYRSIFWNRTILFQAFPCERKPGAFHFSERNGTI